MNLRLKRMSDRMQEIINESNYVLNNFTHTEYGTYIKDTAVFEKWNTKAMNILAMTFGESSIQYKRFIKLASGNVHDIDGVNSLLGVLQGCKDDLDNGFIIGQEYIIAGEIFDSLIEESKHLLKTNHKDAAAVLGRVVLEDSLKRIAKNNEVDFDMKAARINDELKKIEIYSQPQWRLIQAWLDIGNSAAHGKFDEYTSDDVKNMLAGLEQFLSSESFR